MQLDVGADQASPHAGDLPGLGCQVTQRPTWGWRGGGHTAASSHWKHFSIWPVRVWRVRAHIPFSMLSKHINRRSHLPEPCFALTDSDDCFTEAANCCIFNFNFFCRSFLHKNSSINPEIRNQQIPLNILLLLRFSTLYSMLSISITYTAIYCDYKLCPQSKTVSTSV